jgi:hypothetical protein
VHQVSIQLHATYNCKLVRQWTLRACASCCLRICSQQYAQHDAEESDSVGEPASAASRQKRPFWPCA